MCSSISGAELDQSRINIKIPGTFSSDRNKPELSFRKIARKYHPIIAINFYIFIFPFWILRDLFENWGYYQWNILQIPEHMSSEHAKKLICWRIDNLWIANHFGFLSSVCQKVQTKEGILWKPVLSDKCPSFPICRRPSRQVRNYSTSIAIIIWS